MKLEISAEDFPLGDSLRGTVESHLRLVLSRYEGLIELAEVTLDNVHGNAHGGIDKRCMIKVTLPKSRSVLVQVTEHDIVEAIQYCTHKLNRTLSRQVEIRRHFKRPRSLNENLNQEIV